MATNAGIGYGSSFGIHNGSTYVDVAEVTNITWPGYARDAVDATHMTSPDSFREYIAGLMDAGEATIEMNFVPSASDVIVAAMVAGAGNFQIEHPNGVKLQFAAIVTGYDPGIPLDDKMTASATFKVSGKPTLVAA
jgi:hypothetical protein